MNFGGKMTLYGVLYNIVKYVASLDSLGIDLASLLKVKSGSGCNTLFWLKDWTRVSSLATRFPAIFDLDKKKYAYVVEMMAPQLCYVGLETASFR